MYVEIDSKSGFCHGVVNAISRAEEALKTNKSLYSIGDIVHNSVEVERLKLKGLHAITNDEMNGIKDSIILLRAHGEPPSTYDVIAINRNIIIDATCPVVLRLQQRIKRAYEEMNAIGGQIIIYGKQGHAEVVGLVGQTENNAIVISSIDDIEKISFDKPAIMFSQTTQNILKFHNLIKDLEQRFYLSNQPFRWHDTICRQVANRDTHLREWVKTFDVVVFVSDLKSSNGAYLFSVCKKENSQSYFISMSDDLQKTWFKEFDRVGICGATSTPRWLMENIKSSIEKMFA